MTRRELEEEARALYEDYRAAKPVAEDGFVLPPWAELQEQVRIGWRGAAVGSLKRRQAAVGGPIDPDPPEPT